MELSISFSSFRGPTIIPQRFKASSHDNRLIPIKTTTNKLSLPPVQQLYGESRFSKSFLCGQHKRSHIRACDQVEPTGSDSDSVLAKAQVESGSSDSVLAKVGRFGSVYYKFLRPYATHEAIISAICLFARVFVENPQLFRWSLLLKAFPGLIAIILAHAYFIGINQIYDVDIDRVNKPYLPIPAGDLSLKQAWFLVIFNLLMGLLIFPLMGADLITTSIYCLGIFFSTFYSAPPFRFKKYSITASIVLPLTCSVLHNVGVVYATRASLGLPFIWSPPVVFIITFATLFFVVLSIIKDLTDVEGDMKYNIRTFAAIFGPKNIAFLGTGILLVNYTGAIAATVFLPEAFKSYIMLPSHAIFALWLLFQARKLDKANYTKEASANFFQFLWKLLNLEFILFLFI
nr:putative prenyltransferase [Morus alba]